MQLLLRLVRERCRVEQIADNWLNLIVVYALELWIPPGIHSTFIALFQEALSHNGLRMYSIDIFDEMIKITLPLQSRARMVEQALSEAV